MYSKTHWQDRVVDPETGEVVQEGTFMSAEHFNNMEDGIEANDTAISEISESVETIETTLDTGVGTTITLTVNSSTFVMKLALKNSEGNILSESEVDLPIESMIVNAEYVEATKSLVLTLQSGSKVTVPFSALINGLVNDTRKVAGMDLKKDITVAEMVTALGVDKKANKTSVSLSKPDGETTSVINVTDAKAQMAMVASIKGKTHKTVNLFDIDTVCATVSGFRKVDAETFVVTNSTVTVMTGFKANTQYAFSGWVKNNTTGGAVRFRIVYTDSSVTDTVQNNDTGTMVYRYSVSTAGKTISKLQIYYGASGEATYKQFMVEESNVIHDYEPYGQLWNAAVESVVSVGKNLATKKLIGYNINASGVIEVNSAYDIYYAKVEKGKNYAFTQIGTMVSGFFYNVPKTGEKTYDGVRIVYDGNSMPNYITAPITGYVVYRVGGGATTQVMINEGTTRLPYTPPYETTVLVPSSVKNLPDYGCSVGDIANEIDFENGVYIRRVGTFDLSKSGWKENSTGQALYFTDVPTNSKTLGEAICSKFETVKKVPNAAGNICVHESQYNKMYLFTGVGSMNAQALAEYCKDVKIVYELATPETLPLSDYIRPLPVENGGTLTLVNPYNLDMNSTIKYKKEVN